MSGVAEIMASEGYQARRLTRAERYWSEYAGAPVQVEDVAGVLYAFGDELPIRRLAVRMGGAAEYSVNLGTWFYANG